MNTLNMRLNTQALRWALLAAVALNLLLVFGRALSFPGFFSMPDSVLYLLEPVAPLQAHSPPLVASALPEPRAVACLHLPTVC